MDKIPKLGNLITDDQPRDAVHIAIAPVVASDLLYPGERIGFVGDAYTVGSKPSAVVGIVDPFLENPVKKGDKFYMFLLPNTITSLRHDWTHPAFEAEDTVAEYEPTFFKLKGAVEEEKWITEFAEHIGTNYNDLMDAAKSYLSHGEYFVQGGDFEGYSIPDEFWEKYQIVTRETVDEDDRGSFLSCSC
jgi:hypothetical protein